MSQYKSVSSHLLGESLTNMTDAVMLTSVFGVVNPKQQFNDR